MNVLTILRVVGKVIGYVFLTSLVLITLFALGAMVVEEVNANSVWDTLIGLLIILAVLAVIVAIGFLSTWISENWGDWEKSFGERKRYIVEYQHLYWGSPITLIKTKGYTEAYERFLDEVVERDSDYKLTFRYGKETIDSAKGERRL